MIDKNQAVIDYLLTCPSVLNSPLYFNFINAKNDNKQIVTMANDKAINQQYIDGSIRKRYTFTIINFKSVTFIPIPKQEGMSNENVTDMLNVQEIIDWISEQSELRNYPNFGENCIIEDIRTTTDNPNLNGVDNSLVPALAKYSISIQIDYLDTSKMIWKGE